MKAMIINTTGAIKSPLGGPVNGRERLLDLVDLPDPVPADNQIVIRVSTCGVCHTELDEIEGRTPPPVLPVIPGHQVVGRVCGRGPRARRFREGDRVGVAWIFSSCGHCRYCLEGNENLCPEFKATGRDAHGGYAELMAVSEDYAYPIPDRFSDLEAAPLLCAGAVGYRSLKLAVGDPPGPAGEESVFNFGLTGFGASGHIVLKAIRFRYPQAKVFVFARSSEEQAFARELGASWAGGTEEHPPELLDCVIDTTPVWKPVVEALGKLRPGGRLVINAIRKEAADQDALLALDYSRDLWMEKEIKSVANVTRRDVKEFLELAARIPIRPEVQVYRLEEANRALLELKGRKIRGAKVLQVG